VRKKTSANLIGGLLLVGLTLGFLILFKIIIVSGYSMAPTYHNGQVLLMKRFGADYDYGDVIILKQEDQKDLVKRIIGLPGDVIRLEMGKIFRNDIELSPYTCEEETLATYILEENEYFVIGDNYKDSIDSRQFGPVTIDNILGEIISVNP
jgi:signal peptidase I